MRYEHGTRGERTRDTLTLNRRLEQESAPLPIEREPTPYEQLPRERIRDLYTSEDELLDKASEIVLRRGFECLAEAIRHEVFSFPDMVVILDTSARPLIAGIKPLVDSATANFKNPPPPPDYQFLVLFRDKQLIEYGRARKRNGLDVWRDSVQQKSIVDALIEGNRRPNHDEILAQQEMYVSTWEASLARLRSLILGMVYRTKVEPVQLLFVDDYMSQGHTISVLNLMIDELENDPAFPTVDRSFFAFFAALQEGETSSEFDAKVSEEFGGVFRHGADSFREYLLTDFSGFPYTWNGGFVIDADAKEERQLLKSRGVGVRKIQGQPLAQRAKYRSLSARESLNQQIRVLAEPFIFSSRQS